MITRTFHYNRNANSLSKKEMKAIGEIHGVGVSFNKSAFVGAFEINVIGTQKALDKYLTTTKLKGES
jgi:hypothetical protein